MLRRLLQSCRLGYESYIVTNGGAMRRWFKRLAEVPGVSYAGSPQIQRAKLPGYNSVPRQVTVCLGKDKHATLFWPRQGGKTGSSPAWHHANINPPATWQTAQYLRRLQEVLELPGEPRDYHFGIQGCIEVLWQRRQGDPALYQQIEELCWLDIRLIEAQPEAVADERDGEKFFYHVLAFGRLLRLYELEGFLNEALDVAKRAAHFQQPLGTERLLERVARIQAEP